MSTFTRNTFRDWKYSYNAKKIFFPSLSPLLSLGRSADSNPYSEYRKLTGDMKFSRNMRALKLYSETVGAFLSNNKEETWLTPDLIVAARWLSQNNCYIKPLTEYITSYSINSAKMSQTFPTAQHIPNYMKASHSMKERCMIKISIIYILLLWQDLYKSLATPLLHFPLMTQN